jgi:LPS-assembly lipoprotein
MSLPDRRAVLAALLVTAAALGGCQVHPLYANLGNGRTVADELAAVQVQEVQGRLGHYLDEELKFELTGGNEPPPPRYKLGVTVTERVETPVADVFTGRAQAATIQVEAEFVLTRISDGAEVMKGRAVGSASYDRLNQRFAGLRAGRDAEIRISKLLAEQIKTRLATKLITQA